METLLQILVVLLLARAFGAVAHRFGQSATVGELSAGICLALIIVSFGPWLGPLAGLAESSALAGLADLGVFALILMAGVEMEPKEIARQSAGAFFVALGGLLLPLLLGGAFGWLVLPESPIKLAQAMVIGIALSITAIPATIKVLGEFDLLHSRLGELVVAAALFDDVLGLVLLAVLIALAETGATPDWATLLWLVAKVALFFLVTTALGIHIYPRISGRLKELQAVALELSALVIAALAYGVIAELLGLHWILGAFMAGLFFESSRVGETVYRDVRLFINAITLGVLGPFFFASIGLRVDLGALVAIPLVTAALTVLAFAGKAVGAGLPAALIGLPRGAAMAVGVSMTSRGAVELVLLAVAYEAGLFPTAGPGASAIVGHLFSALVIMALANTLFMPVALRFVLRRHPTER